MKPFETAVPEGLYLDPQGRPLAFYHFSACACFDADSFRPWSHFGTRQAAENVWGWKQDCWEYTAAWLQPAVYRVYLRIARPLMGVEGSDATDTGSWAWTVLQWLGKAKSFEGSPEAAADFALEALKDAGFDLVVYQNSGEGGLSAIVVSPRQVVPAALAEFPLPGGRPALRFPGWNADVLPPLTAENNPF